MPKYDVAIIGSGLGGLVCGYILSKEGLKVCVVEKNHQIGGCLQSFTRDGCIFDTGIHYLGSLDEGQILNRYFKYLNLMSKLKLKKMDENGFDKICFDGDDTEYRYGMGIENFVNIMHGYFPKEKESLRNYVAKLKDVCDNFGLYSLNVKKNQMYENAFSSDSAFLYINSITNDLKLQNVLAGINQLYAGLAKKTPLYMHALIKYSYILSAYRLVDGSGQIADLLASSIENNDGIILKNYEAQKFLFKEDKIEAVIFQNGEILEAKNFISNTHPVNTLEMISPEHVRKIYWNKIYNLENTISTFTLYLSFKKNSFPYYNNNYYLFRENNVWTIDLSSGVEWPENLFCLTPATSSSDKYADSMIIIAYMKFDEVKKWHNTTVEKRGKEYEDFKNEKTEKVLKAACKKFPNLRECIKSVYTSTPLTYRDYTGTKNGSLYGIVRDCNEPYKSFISHRTKIPNLFLTGQNIIMHGALGVVIGAVVTCSEFLGMDYLVGKIRSV